MPDRITIRTTVIRNSFGDYSRHIALKIEKGLAGKNTGSCCSGFSVALTQSPRP